MTEYRKYDSDCKTISFGARLTKDAEVKDFGERQAVRLTYVSTSRREGDSDMWIEATASDRQADLAKYLKKGDTLGIEGHLTMRKYGEPEKVAFSIPRAELHVPIALFSTLKERGFTPGAKPPGQSAPATKPLAKPAQTKNRPVVNLDDEE